MDEQRAIELISELQSKVNRLTQERNNYASMLVNYEAFIKRIPRTLPKPAVDDCEYEFTANAWLEWAKEQLGYEDTDRPPGIS